MDHARVEAFKVSGALLHVLLKQMRLNDEMVTVLSKLSSGENVEQARVKKLESLLGECVMEIESLVEDMSKEAQRG